MYPNAFVQYLVHFHGDRDYFECHEILEEYWKYADKGNKNSIWVAFIQVAVSAYHHRRTNFPGARKSLEKALSIFHNQQPSINVLGLDPKALITLLQKQLLMIEKMEQYTSFNLPISDTSLLKECENKCMELGFVWKSSSDLSNEALIQRHIFRDRTHVIKEREQALKQKKATSKD